MKKINYAKLVGKVRTKEKQIKFLQECGILDTSKRCDSCDKELKDLYSEKGYYYFRCLGCKKKISVRRDSILSNANVSMCNFILLAYLFVANYWTYAQIQVISKILN